MPAAAVIPAPIAYIKVAAVKKLVVGSWERGERYSGSGIVGCNRGQLQTYGISEGTDLLLGQRREAGLG